MAGADLYLNRIPSLGELAEYAVISAVLSPVYAVAIALKGGWIQQRYGARLVLFLVGAVLLGVLAAWLIGAAP